MLLKTFQRILGAKFVLGALGMLILCIHMWTGGGSTPPSSSGQTVVLLDLASSMNTPDGSDDTARLVVAQQLIYDMIKHTSSPIGVIGFDQKITYFIPPTTDYLTLGRKVALLHTRSLERSKPGEPLYEKGEGLVNVITYAVSHTQPSTNFVLISDFDTATTQLPTLDHLPNNINFTIIALGSQQPQPMRDADGTELSTSTVGRNDRLGERLASILGSDYHINPAHIDLPNFMLLSHNSSPYRLVWIATLFLTLVL